jgi:cytochrome oxidase assembly protein ShyY1
MLALLRRPRWLGMFVFVLALASLFIRLGFWQLERKEARAEENTVLELRLAADPVPVGVAVAAAGSDLPSVEFRRGTATGVYRPDLELLVRNRTNEMGTAGFHLLTPLELEDGSLVIVNRGWIPLEIDEVPVEPLSPPAAEVDVTGLMRATESRSAIGPIDPPGRITVVNRIDLDRIGALFDQPVLPVWLQALETLPGGLPEPLVLPDTNDAGPHLSYAIQWFSFATIALVGFGVVLRRGASPRKRHLPPLDAAAAQVDRSPR